MRAANRGILDFTKARVLDKQWWAYVRARLGQMARDDAAASAQVSFHYYCALLANSKVFELGMAQQVFDAVKSLHDEVQHDLEPWHDAKIEQANKITSLIDAYKTLVGDPSDPAFKQRMEEGYKRWLEEQNAPVRETDEERIDRLVREREERKAQQTEEQRKARWTRS